MTHRDVDRIVRTCRSCPKEAATPAELLGRRKRHRPSQAGRRSPVIRCPYEALPDDTDTAHVALLNGVGAWCIIGMGNPLNRRPATMSSIEGELVTETLEYDGGRQVTAYLPPDPPEAIVFAGDGQLIAQWGGALEANDVPPTMIVGAHRLDDEMLRLHEYSPAFDPVRFAAHEKFFVEDVRRWAASRFEVALPTERTAVFGVSASGELALALGLSHPDVYGAIFCASPGAGYRPPEAMPPSVPRTYLVAGTLEPFFLENATRWATALRDADADVVITERVGSHGDAFWQEELPLMVAWAFGR